MMSSAPGDGDEKSGRDIRSSGSFANLKVRF